MVEGGAQANVKRRKRLTVRVAIRISGFGMLSLFERLAAAVAPEYELERELGAGGMGVVFLARDVSLGRRVAIKIIRPELATALAAERFQREARLLAQLAHPNVVSVHRAGEAGGLFYYVMDYVDGSTLAERLEAGRLSVREAARLGEDLLRALGAAHRLGIVHRDVKPSNIFLTPDRALLADFGIASHSSPDAEPLTLPGKMPGTPGYMPPEQAAAMGVGPHTDLYAIGIVLYEAVTGRRWALPASEAHADWSGIPRPLAQVLRRALAWLPADRFRDAEHFRRALTQVRVRPYIRRTIALAAGGLVVGAGGAWLAGWFWPSPPAEGHATRAVRIAPFSVVEGAEPGVGDSLARLIAADLAGSPDFTVVMGTRGAQGADVELRGTLRATGPLRCAAATLQRSSGGRVTPLGNICAPGGHLVDLADSLASLTLLELWTGREPLIADLPRSALPRTPWGIAAWARAEHLFIQGRWGEAYKAYGEAERADSTCWLCSWRLSMTEDWMSIPHDPLRTERYLTHADSFPPQYASLVRAKSLPLGARLDSLRAAASRYPRFFFAWFMLGDELFHRGPLAGRSVDEGVHALERATELGPGFAPAWEHLAWAATGAGDSALARHALGSWIEAMGGKPRDAFSVGLAALLEAGYAWRFDSPKVAAGLVKRFLQSGEIDTLHYLIEGPRYLPTFDAPRGAVWLGTWFAAPEKHADLQRSGLMARAFGYVALGQPDSARATLQALVQRFPEPDVSLFVYEYSGALAVADSAAVPGWRSRVLTELRRAAAPEAGNPRQREQATWMAALLSRDTGQFRGAAPLRDLLEAWQLAQAGRWREAIARTDRLQLNADSEPLDPVLRALTRLGRGEWYARAGGDPAAVRRELRWAEHEDVVGTLDVNPQAADVDWSFRTLARWKLATALDRAGEHDVEVCRAYRRVADLWAGGAPIYRVRADSARQRLSNLAVCHTTS
jgi:hypothetical protein